MTNRISISQVIDQARDLSIWLHEKTDKRSFSVREEGRKRQIGVALLQQSLDLSDAIIVLLEANFPGPSWSLARPLFESYVRGIWILRCASNTDVERFRKTRVPKFERLLEEIEREASSHAKWIRITHNNMKHFHDFTHGGIEHAMRRINDGVVEPSFPESELIYLVQLGIEVRIRVGLELFSPSLLNDNSAIMELNHRVKCFHRHPLS